MRPKVALIESRLLLIDAMLLWFVSTSSSILSNRESFLLMGVVSSNPNTCDSKVASYFDG